MALFLEYKYIILTMMILVIYYLKKNIMMYKEGVSYASIRKDHKETLVSLRV